MVLTKTPISIVEDNTDFRWVVESFINRSKLYYLNYAYGSCEELFENLASDRSRIILMDIDLPGISGIEGIKNLKKINDKVEIIVVTVFENSETVFSALRAGASGYLTKTVTEQELINAIDECRNGGAPMSMKIAKMVVKSFNRSTKSPLTERETEVLSCIANGMSYSSSGEKLFISKETVKFHIKNIYIKLQVKSKEEAIRVANRDKLI